MKRDVIDLSTLNVFTLFRKISGISAELQQINAAGFDN